MIDSIEFTNSILQTIPDHIVVIDRQFNIQFVNRSWVRFGEENACQIDSSWQGVNYLKTCEDSAAMGDEFGRNAAAGIQRVVNSDIEVFYFEYPCHSPDKKRWFMMRVTPFKLNNEAYFVISHQNITERKLAEEKVANHARVDGLTRISNRRCFDEFLDNEWRRCARLNLPVTLALIDLDHFKSLNDQYGHQAGDDCLRKTAEVLKDFARRPSDICARYGGEEFAIVHGNSGMDTSLPLMNKMLEAIRALKIPNENSTTAPILTASVGLATMQPTQANREHELIAVADKLLYAAKESGRNRVRTRLD